SNTLCWAQAGPGFSTASVPVIRTVVGSSFIDTDSGNSGSESIALAAASSDFHRLLKWPPACSVEQADEFVFGQCAASIGLLVPLAEVASDRHDGQPHAT
ncbi:MAG: hypothetical protein ACKVII_00355, partial [Planctomycetales bacterium]